MLLAAAAAWLALLADASSADSATGYLPLPWLLVAGLFFVAEASALHIEIRRETHSLSLSGIPLLLGLLALGPVPLIAARLAGSATALVFVRRRAGLKLAWNLALYALEASAAVLIASIALRDGPPAQMADWVTLLSAVLLAELIGLLSVPVVIMLAEFKVQLAMYAQVGRSQLIALVSTTFGVVTAAAMLDQVWLATFAVVPIIGVALLLRLHGQLGKEHHDLQQVHGFTNAITGRDPLDTGLSQLATILRSDLAGVAVRQEDGQFSVRLLLGDAYADRMLELDHDPAVGGRTDEEALAPFADGSESANRLIRLDADTPPCIPGELVRLLGGRSGLATPISGPGQGEAYVLLANRLGTSSTYGKDEARLFASLATNLGARLSADHLLEQLETQARIDALTGLVNRNTLEAELDRRVGSECDSGGAVLLLDLDRFKDINDSLGHQVGDEVLRAFANRIRGQVRANDLAGRLGGDEFTIILADCADDARLEANVASLAQRLNQPLEIDGITLELGASIGIARWPNDATTGTELLRQADIAMYEAKRTHQPWVRYRAELDHANTGHLALLGQLREGLTAGELQIHLQPQVRTGSLELVGAEALLRWYHPTEGLVPPGIFIPLAEQSNLAGPITRHVISQGVMAVRRLEAMNIEASVSVNLTARDLLDRTLPANIAGSVAAGGVDPSRLIFEVTEGSLIVDIDTAIRHLHAIRELGCRTSVDDFGTGYASLQYLQRLPIDEVKIDRSFIAKSAVDPNSKAIVRAMTRLVHELGLEVVAEGIDDLGTLDLLRQLGCDTIQGYLVAKAMPVDDFLRWATIPVAIDGAAVWAASDQL
ncbi:MAG: EAL domain-containing protein [Actinomycetota bacterium]